MKKIILLLLLLISFTSIAQDYQKSWAKIINYENEGKIKSANRELEYIYKKASSDKNEVQIIKCFFYKSKYIQTLEEDSQYRIISNLEQEISKSSIPSKAILNYVYATCLKNYLTKNGAIINRRNKLDSTITKDFNTWTSTDFKTKIDALFAKTLENEPILKATSLKKYEPIFDFLTIEKLENSSLFEYLVNENIEHYKSRLYSDNYIEKKESYNFLLGSNSEFRNQAIDSLQNSDLKKVLGFYKKFDSKNEASIIEFDRIKFCNDYILRNDNVYLASLNSLQKRTNDDYLIQKIQYEKALILKKSANKKNKPNSLTESIKLLDSIISKESNYNTKKLAIQTKKEIQKKELNVQVKKIICENENTRARVEYRNIDSIKIAYYKVVTKNQYDDFSEKNTLLSSIIDGLKPTINKTYILENKKDYYSSSTEILLPNLQIGTYIIEVESLNTSEFENKKTYDVIAVTNTKLLSYKIDSKTHYQILNRKTGKPIANCKLTSDIFILTTNDKGIAIYTDNETTNNYNSRKITITKDLDSTIVFVRNNNNFNTKHKDVSTKTSATIFLDRAIYRPGQKVYFKTIVTQTDNETSNVIPNLLVKMILEDSNDEEVKSIEATTNEFGSISGEFELPKNGITGDYRILIDEPENYETDGVYDAENEEHPIWDNFGIANVYATFAVEEYKRPKFEVTFNPVKETFVLNQLVTISGNAKSFSNSSISNAAVEYRVSRNNSYNYYSDDNDSDGITISTGKTITDASGNFKIEFKAFSDASKIVDENTFHQYIVTVFVIDSNGETQSKKTTIIVGNQTTILNLNLPKIIKSDQNALVNFTSTNLNNQFKAVKGDIRIYYLKPFDNKFKGRLFGQTETNTISKEQFEILFPHEKYSEKDATIINETLLFSKKINTLNDNQLALDFIKNYQSGNYKIVISAFDADNNKVEKSQLFEIIQVNDEKLNGKDIFSFTQLNENPKKDGYALINIKCAVKNLYISCIAVFNQTLLFNQDFEIDGYQTTIKIPVNEMPYTNFPIRIDTFYENQFFSKLGTITNLDPIIIQPFSFETLSFRNKLEPGSLENWSFKIKDNKRTSFEILASMYDKSLDAFHTEDWQQLPIYKSFYSRLYEKSNTDEYSKHISLNTSINYKKVELNNERNKLIWFGFNFVDSNNYKVNAEYRKQVTKKSKKPKNVKFIYGVVSDSSGPLPGANVVVKGTTRGVSTDVDGYYEIDVAPGEVLVFSFVGLSDEMKTVGNVSKTINVNLQNGATSLDEVLISTGIGVVKRRDAITSSTSIVAAKELSQAGSPSVVQSLVGKVSGLQINVSNGQTNVIINGSRSITGNNTALVVIDGLFSNATTLNSLAPADVIEIEVLKSNEAIERYGEKGANGAIVVITTKSIAQLTQVKTRTNRNETAFFFPHIKTDKDGNFNFSFTSPEELTQWKLRLFGHNKKANFVFDEKTVITQKELMVFPNMPRFLRENDTISISTKISNLSSEIKNGMAVLQLFDATTMESIDVKMNNENAVKNFTINPSGNTVVKWNITIPSGLQGVQYKVIAKAGNHSDGEESILPVLTNSILVTESIPVWARENSKKEYTFENLKNTTSSTLKNHQFTFEYTSNPTWLAIQSLPYLMEYEHQCAEQTFSRYYANVLATEIINSNPTISKVFENWKKLGKPTSKLEQNEELKSLILAETPWLKDVQSEEDKRKNLVLLFDLENMKNSLEVIFKKLKEKQKSSGGFPWFDGGNESEYITRHIVAGLGHLEKLKVNEDLIDSFDEITKTAIPYLDSKFIDNNKEFEKAKKINLYSDLHYLYARSFYLSNYPISDKTKAIINQQLKNIIADWKQYSLYNKGLASLILYRFDKKESAKTIIESLKETASTNEDWGMYWIENKSGWYWYQAPIETQALLIEAFSEVTNDTKSIDAMKIWLLKNKQTKNWPTTKATTEAIYALLMQGSNWLTVKDNTIIKIGDEKIMTKKLTESEKEAETGYIKMTWKADEVKKEMASITVENKSKVPGYGGIYWQYFEDLDKIKSNTGTVLSTAKELYIKKNSGKGDELVRINPKNPLKIGDLVTVRIIVTAKEDMEYVHLKDMRASCFEPINVLSEYKWNDGLSYYMSTKDAATHFFFDRINKGTYVIEYDIRVNNSGNFSNGITTIQSMYAPEFTSHTKGIRVETKE